MISVEDGEGGLGVEGRRVGLMGLGREVDGDGGGVGRDVEPLEEEGVGGTAVARVRVQVWLSPFH